MSFAEIEDESYQESRDTRTSHRKNVMSEGEKRFRRQVKDRGVVVKTVRNEKDEQSTSGYSDHVMYSLNKDKRWEKTVNEFLEDEEGAAVVERKIGSKVHKTLPLSPKRSPALFRHWPCQAEKAMSSEKHKAVLAVSNDVIAVIKVPTAVVVFAAPIYRSYFSVTRSANEKYNRDLVINLEIYPTDYKKDRVRYEIFELKEKLYEMQRAIKGCWSAGAWPQTTVYQSSIEENMIQDGNWVALNAFRKMGDTTTASPRKQRIYAKDHAAMINDVMGIRKDEIERLEDLAPRNYWDAEEGVVGLHTVDSDGEVSSRTASGRGVKISGMVRRNKEEAEEEVPDVLYNIIRPELHKPLAKKTFRREKPRSNRERKNIGITDDVSDQ